MDSNQIKKYFSSRIFFYTLFILVLFACSPGQKNKNSPENYLPSQPHNIKLDSLKILAQQIVNSVRNNPEGRYQMRKEFYERYGHGEFSEFGFGNSEIAFLSWEKRGLFNSPEDTPPGSPWWRNVNLEFMYYSELAALIHEEGLDTLNFLKVPVQVDFWLDFIDTPSSKHWYRAHNSSIIAAYEKYTELAKDEILAEQVFINMVLYRLLFAQAMVESEHFAFGKLGAVLANPKLPAVKFIVHDPFFYPSTYPLTKHEQNIILGKVHSIGELEVKFLDYYLIMPHLEELYTKAAEINNTVGLLSFIKEGRPVYPN